MVQQALLVMVEPISTTYYNSGGGGYYGGGDGPAGGGGSSYISGYAGVNSVKAFWDINSYWRNLTL